MFRAHIVVGEDTDIAAEIAKIEDRARGHAIDPVHIQTLLTSAEAVMGDLKRQASETAAHGISLNVTKYLTSADSAVSIEVQSSGEPARSGFLSRLFRR